MMGYAEDRDRGSLGTFDGEVLFFERRGHAWFREAMGRLAEIHEIPNISVRYAASRKEPPQRITLPVGPAL
jgi:hypothetical protein